MATSDTILGIASGLRAFLKERKAGRFAQAKLAAEQAKLSLQTLREQKAFERQKALLKAQEKAATSTQQLNALRAQALLAEEQRKSREEQRGISQQERISQLLGGQPVGQPTTPPARGALSSLVSPQQPQQQPVTTEQPLPEGVQGPPVPPEVGVSPEAPPPQAIGQLQQQQQPTSFLTGISPALRQSALVELQTTGDISPGTFQRINDELIRSQRFARLTPEQQQFARLEELGILDEVTKSDAEFEKSLQRIPESLRPLARAIRLEIPAEEISGTVAARKAEVGLREKQKEASKADAFDAFRQEFGPEKVFQAQALVASELGQRKSDDPSTVGNVLAQIREGKNIDQIRDELFQTGFSKEFFGTQLFETFQFLSPQLSKQAKKSIGDEVDRLVEAGNVGQAKELLLTTAIGKGVSSADEAKKFGGIQQTLASLDAIESAMNEYHKKGGKLGLLYGNAEEAAQRLGDTLNPELAQLGTEIMIAVQSYRQALSGAAFSTSEQREYQRVFPQLTAREPLNMARIRGIRNVQLRNARNFLARKLGRRNVLGGDVFTPEEIDSFIRGQNIPPTTMQQQPTTQLTLTPERFEQMNQVIEGTSATGILTPQTLSEVQGRIGR